MDQGNSSVTQFDKLYKFTQENKGNNLPLIFIRVRNVEQFETFSKMLRKEHLTILCGFSFPKFNSENGDGYFSVLNNLCNVHNEILYGMPIIEDKKVMYKEQLKSCS